MDQIKASTFVNADIRHVMAILRDVEAYGRFMPSITKAKVLSRTPLSDTVEWSLEIDGVQIEWIEERIYDATGISFRAIRGDMQVLDGRWTLDPYVNSTRLGYEANIDWGIPSFEKLVGPILTSKARGLIEGMLKAIEIRSNRLGRRSVSDGLDIVGKFAFVIHPLDIDLIGVAFDEPSISSRKRVLLKKVFEWMPSFQCSNVSGVRSRTGSAISGLLMYCSLLPDQMMELESKAVLAKVVEAGRLAQKRGAKILGLGAYAAQVGKKGVEVARALKIPVTTGTHYTVYIAIKSVEDIARRMNVRLEDSVVTVVGASGGIGRVCAEYYAGKCKQLILVARNQSRLDKLCHYLKSRVSSKLNILTTADAKKSLAVSDIAIISTTTPEPLADVSDLKSGAIVCDISRPRNITQSTKRDDVVVVDGGIVYPPGTNIDFNFYFGLPAGMAYACMAETMILTMENRYENYSLGGEVSFEKVLEIGMLGEKHGFKLAKIFSFGNELNIEGPLIKLTA